MGLTLLQEHHLLQVPFENLDIHYGVHIILDEDRILRKIVSNRRGGFCYELNSAFAWLLTKLGYSVSVRRGGQERGRIRHPLRPYDSSVDLDQPWLVDVGFGDSLVSPPLINGVTV